MNDLSQMYVDSDETQKAILGSGYIGNFLSTGSLDKGFCSVTNKRVYFKGKSYYKSGNSYKKSNEERIVDLNDITGTGFVISRIWLLKILAFIIGAITLFCEIGFMINGFEKNDAGGITLGGSSYEAGVNRSMLMIMLLVMIPEIIIVVLYIIKKLRLFEISYAGGRIAFKASEYSEEEIQEFQKQLRLAKDNFKPTPVAAPVVNVSANSSVTDELKKLKDLLDSGAITQEEYNELKADALKKY